MTLPLFMPVTGKVSVVSSQTFNALFAALPNALDPVGGGTWESVAPSTVNGANTFTFGCPVVMSGDTILSNVSAITVPNGGTLTAEPGSTVLLQGDITQSGALTKSGATGTTRWRTASATVGVKIGTGADIYVLPAPLVETTFTLDETSVPPEDGMVIVIWRQAFGAFHIFLERESAVQIARLPANTHCGITLTWYTDLGGWRVTGTFGMEPLNVLDP